MKKNLKKSLCYIFLIVTYTLQSVETFKSNNFPYFIGFILSIAVLYIVQNKYAGAFAGMAVLVLSELYSNYFYNLYYVYLTLPVYLMICVHKNIITDNDEKTSAKDISSFSYLLHYSTLILTLFLLAESVVFYYSNPKNEFITEHFYALLPICFFAFLFTASFSKKPQKNKSGSKNNSHIVKFLHSFYLQSLIGVVISVLFVYVHISYLSLTYNGVFFPWFVFICTICYDGDPCVNMLTDAIGDFLEKIIKRKV